MMISKERKENNFLIINPFGIGDCLFTIPVIREIKKKYPGCSIGYWCNARVEGILNNSSYIDRIFSLSRGDFKKICQISKIKGLKTLVGVLRDIKRGKYDIALDFSLDHRYGLLTKLIGIKERIGFDYRGRGRFLTKKIYIDGYSGKHMVDSYLDLLKFIGIDAEKGVFELEVPDSKSEAADVLLSNSGINKNDLFVAIAPGAGASWGKDAKFKHWPSERYAALAERIFANYGMKVVILGDDSEKEIAKTIVSRAAGKLVNLAGCVELELLPAIIKRAKVLVTNDGGPLHIAVAVGTKTVSVFGPVDEKVYGPYPGSQENIVISNNMLCRPCYQKFKMAVCKIEKACINSITVDQVFDAVRRLI